MLGAPGEARSEMLQTIELATRLPAAEASFSLFVPIPGTDVHKRMVEEGYQLSTDFTDYDYYARQPFEGEVSRRELRMIQRWAYLRFYAHPQRWRSVARAASTTSGMRSLGRKLLTHVRDVMRAGDAIPRVQEDTPLSQALMEITRKGMAMTAVVDADGHAVGVFTDGDLRRLLETPRDWRTVPMTEVMHHNPRSIGPDQLAVEAVEVMETHRINQLLVVDAAGVLVGALHIHDLTRAKVI
jgi:CBS domain-containing protein